MQYHLLRTFWGNDHKPIISYTYSPYSLDYGLFLNVGLAILFTFLGLNLWIFSEKLTSCPWEISRKADQRTRPITKDTLMSQYVPRGTRMSRCEGWFLLVETLPLPFMTPPRLSPMLRQGIHLLADDLLDVLWRPRLTDSAWLLIGGIGVASANLICSLGLHHI